jgi:hypothetical protein
VPFIPKGIDTFNIFQKTSFFEYLVEKARDQDFTEDLFTPGVFRCRLKAGDKLGVIASTQNPTGRDALAIMASIYKAVGLKASARRFAQRTVQTRDRFRETFWYEEGGYLYDSVAGEKRDTSIRPNQIFTLSLPYPLLEGQQAKMVLETVTDKLYTPFGLRSLAPEDPHYRPVYSGNGSERDSAYHQGTVWAWLLGPWLTAVARVNGREGKATAKNYFKEIMPYFEDAGIGTVSEIFDADWPHAPRGCIAQAWSVSEILRPTLKICKARNSKLISITIDQREKIDESKLRNTANREIVPGDRSYGDRVSGVSGATRWQADATRQQRGRVRDCIFTGPCDGQLPGLCYLA